MSTVAKQKGSRFEFFATPPENLDQLTTIEVVFKSIEKVNKLFPTQKVVFFSFNASENTVQPFGWNAENTANEVLAEPFTSPSFFPEWIHKHDVAALNKQEIQQLVTTDPLPHSVHAYSVINKNQFHGLITLIDTAATPSTEEHHVDLFEAFVCRMGTDIHLAHSLRKTQRILRRNQLIQDLEEEFSAASSIEDIWKFTLHACILAANTQNGSLMTLNPAKNELEVRASICSGKITASPEGQSFKVGYGIAGLAAHKRQFIICRDASSDERFIPPQSNRSLRSILSVPILSHGKLQFVINVDSEKADAFDKEDARDFQALGKSVAYAIETQRLRDLAAILPTHSLDEIKNVIIEYAVLLTGAKNGNFYFLDKNTDDFNVDAYYPPTDKPRHATARKNGLMVEMARSQRPIHLNNVQKKGGVRKDILEAGINSLIGTPINTLSEGRKKTIGGLFVNSERLDNFDRRDEGLLQSLADLASTAMLNVMAIRKEAFQRQLATQKADQLSRLNDITRRMQSEADLPELLNYISEQAVELIAAADSGGILLFDKKKEVLTYWGNFGVSPEMIKGTRDKPDTNIAGRVVAEGDPIIANDIKNDVRIDNPSISPDIHAIVSTPLRSKGEIIGTLDIHSNKAHAFKTDDLQILELLASQAAISIENTRVLNALEEKNNFQQNVFSNAYSAIITIDRKGFIQGFNQIAQETLGYTADEVKGTLVTEMYDDPLTARKVLRKLIEKKHEGKEPGITDYRTVVRAKGGEKVAIKLSARLLEDGSVGFFQDEQRMTYEEGILKASQEITSGVSHLTKNLHVIVEQAVTLLGGQETEGCYSHIMMVTDDGNLEVRATFPKHYEPLITEFQQLRVSSNNKIGIAGRVFEQGKYENIPDVTVDPDYLNFSGTTQSQLSVPIINQGKTVGVLNFEHPHQGAFMKQDVRTLRLLAEFAAIAIRNADEAGKLEKVSKEISQISRVITTEGSDLKTILNHIAEAITTIAQCDAVSLFIYNPVSKQVEYPFAHWGLLRGDVIDRKTSLKSTSGVYSAIDKLEQPHVAEDLENDPYIGKSFIKREKIKSTIIFPLRVQGTKVGILYVSYRKKWKDYDLTELEFLAAQAAVAIHYVRYREEQKRRNEEETFFSSLLQEDSSILAIVHRTLEYLNAQTSGCISSIWGLSEDGFGSDDEKRRVILQNVVVNRDVYGEYGAVELEALLEKKTSFKLSESFVGQFFDPNKPLLEIRATENISLSEHKDNWSTHEDSIDAQGILALPILPSNQIEGDGNVDLIGVVCIRFKSKDYLLIQEQTDQLKRIANSLSFLITRDRHISRYDQVRLLQKRLPSLLDESETAYDHIVDLVNKILKAECCSLFFADKADKGLRLQATTAKTIKKRMDGQETGSDNTTKRPYQDFAAKDLVGNLIYTSTESSIAYKAMLKKQITLVTDVQQNDDRSEVIIEETESRIHKSMIVAPFNLPGSGREGIVYCINKRRTEESTLQPVFTVQDIFIMELVVNILTQFAEQIEATDNLRVFMMRQTHEYAQPLHALFSYTSIIRELLNDPEKADDARVFMNDIHEELDRLGYLTKNFKLFYELNASRIKYDFSQLVDVYEIIQRMQRLLMPEAQKQKWLKILFKGDHIPSMYIDKRKFEQVIFNLLSNAIKYSKKSYKDIEIVFHKQVEYSSKSNSASSHWAALDIKNWGVGVLKGEEEVIFGDFVRGTNVSRTNTSGTGIGLPLSRNIIKKHGGELILLKYYHPTVFRILLPTSLTQESPSQ